MAPGVTIDNTSDFDMPSFTTPKSSSIQRTLLLAPPSVASHPEALKRVAEAYDRTATDIQMLDRLALGLVSLPAETYDVVLLLTDVDGSRRDSSRLLDRTAMEKLVGSLKVGGRLRAQDGSFGASPGAEQTEAILAGLVTHGDDDGMLKPDSSQGVQTVRLSFGKKKASAAAAATPSNITEIASNGKRKNGDISVDAPVIKSTPAGVGFIDTSDDFEGGFDDGSGYDDDDDDMDMVIPSQEELDRAEKINPETLLTEADRQRPIIVRESYHHPACAFAPQPFTDCCDSSRLLQTHR